MADLLVKLALYGASLGAAGLALTAWVVLSPAEEARGPLRIAAALAVAALIIAVARFGLDAAALAGGWSSVLEPPWIAWTWKAQGPALALLVAGVAAIGLGAILRVRPLAAAGGLVLLASFAATGHVAAEGAPWLRAALAAHLAGVAFWVVAPLVLWPRLTIADAALLARVKAFTRIAQGLVPLALVAGAVLAVVLVGSLPRLLGTGYGRMILIKVVAATAAFTLGALNKTWVTARLAADPPRGRALLRLTLAADALLFASALAAVAAATTVLTPED